MRRLFYNSFLAVFTIIGSVIGAGFITGKEVFEFFASDFSLGGIYLAFLCFSFMIFYMMSSKGNRVDKSIQIFVAISNVIIAGCMISALNSIYKRLFRLSEKVEILSIITAILMFIISYKGIGVVQKLCAITLPFVVVVIITLCVYKVEDYTVKISPQSYGGILKPVIYVGFNVVMSAGVIKNSGEKLSPPFKILASVITSAILCACVFLLSLAVKNEGLVSDMPFISLFYKNKKLLIIIDIITLFAIYSTLASAIYTVNNFGGTKIKFSLKILLFLFIIATSKLSFSSIVEKVYPSLGVLAYVMVCVSYLLSTPFPKARQARTLRLLKDKE